MQSLNELTTSEAARGIACGRFSSEALVTDCLTRIREREPAVMAWQHLDPEYALAQARERDAGPPAGPLHGVPVGIKDTYDTVDMPTTWGSPIYAGNRPASDAAAVALLRAAGAVILGKTVSTEFAGLDPGKTRNPHNTAHTPGGSSSGSAAAVADFMVPVALGSQTAGSVIRPAAFCGVLGFKPSHGVLNRRGMAPIADALDTIGYMTRSIEDLALVLAVLTCRPPPAAASDAVPPRVGVCRNHLWAEADPAAVAAVEDAGSRLAAAGARISQVDLPATFADLAAHQMTLMGFEAARSFAHERRAHDDRLGPKLRDLIEIGERASFADCQAALRAATACRRELAAIFDGHDMLLTVSAKGEAPTGLAATGDMRFQSLWTFLHAPCVSLPTHAGPTGLPIGTQFIGPFQGDDSLLVNVGWAARHLMR